MVQLLRTSEVSLNLLIFQNLVILLENSLNLVVKTGLTLAELDERSVLRPLVLEIRTNQVLSVIFDLNHLGRCVLETEIALNFRPNFWLCFIFGNSESLLLLQRRLTLV